MIDVTVVEPPVLLTVVQYTTPSGFERWLHLNDEGQEVERFLTLARALAGARRMWLLYYEGV